MVAEHRDGHFRDRDRTNSRTAHEELAHAEHDVLLPNADGPGRESSSGAACLRTPRAARAAWGSFSRERRAGHRRTPAPPVRP
ncbi:hypothetical protein [Nonomuraea angiospora]|uniref:hypothetical protein n=1 Tax=Nonomuraea angiospora TaxID=46172 RepID=UPI00178B5D4C|nr:hypothetical protein [Nonomuraea angiospora]